MSRFIQSEDDESSSSLSSSLHSSLHNEPSPPPQTKIPLSTSIILEKKVPMEQQQDILNPSLIGSKIMIRFAPIGSTPSIQPRVFKISSTQTISTLNKFLCKKLKHKGTLHLYIQNSFMPLPDEQIGSLYNHFKTNNELIISYCNTVAFG